MIIICLVLILANLVTSDLETITETASPSDGSLPPGYYPYFVVFKKKPTTPNHPEDFSPNSSFISSGIVLNRRWVLTRAVPIVYYPIRTYTLVVQRFINLPFDFDLQITYEVNFVLLHPDHEPGDLRTDAALVRTVRELKFDFELGNVNLGFNELPRVLENCKIVTWRLLPRVGKKKGIIGKNENAVNIKNRCKDENYFYCLDLERQVCGINSGAPVICDSILVGFHIGGGCEDPLTEDRALKIDNLQEWIKYVLSTPLLFEKKTSDTLVLKKCPNGSNNPGKSYMLLVMLIKLYFL